MASAAQNQQASSTSPGRPSSSGEHNMPWDSTPRIFPTLMVTRRLAGFGRQGVAGQNQRNLVAGFEILRAANDLPFAARRR